MALTAVVMNAAIFWDIAQCRPYGIMFHFQLWGHSVYPPAGLWFLARLIFPWRWEWYVLPKRLFTYGLQCAISQMINTYLIGCKQNSEVSVNTYLACLQFACKFWSRVRTASTQESTRQSIHMSVPCLCSCILLFPPNVKRACEVMSNSMKSENEIEIISSLISLWILSKHQSLYDEA
jgi:hypothetical protein